MRARAGKSLLQQEELIKELEEGTVILIYDIPYPPSSKQRKELAAWYSWYDWSTSLLRSIGYPLQKSVILVSESKIKEIEEAKKRIERKRLSLIKSFGLDIPEPKIAVICFALKSKKDAEALLGIVKEWLKATLEAFVEYIEEQLREGKDRTALQRKVREFVKRIRKQDYLNLLLRDPELRRLATQLEILTA